LSLIDGHLVYFVAIWYILLKFGIYLSRFGMFYRENLAAVPTKLSFLTISIKSLDESFTPTMTAFALTTFKRRDKKSEEFFFLFLCFPNLKNLAIFDSQLKIVVDRDFKNI
jgi:hypothetical protein